MLKASFVLMMACFFVQNSCAQITPAKKTTANLKKYKPPKLYTYLDSYKDSVPVSVAIAEGIIAAPLMVYDDKKTLYEISSYQFLYKKRTVTEDEQSGKTSPSSSVVSNRFLATPLPQLWVNQIREQVKPGEELYFFDVIVKDAQGRLMYAPNVKIMIQ